ncbi:MAG: 30S ribosomal protein S6 [Phycisphaeraceae bacterium]|nr:30S ribosomal protein S6 [Phycisphaerales bacterium]MCB9861378.1 30S ribosomal protein S6 [Phycisphaeraceae bacterium]
MEQRFGMYECMFLASQATAADFAGLIEHIDYLLGRANAEVISMRKWDERRLAFPIEKQKRGIYILAYVKAPREMVTKLERDVAISDKIMRMLIVRADHLSLEEMKAQDGRTELATEAKLRATQAEEQTRRGEAVVAGAPEQQEEPEVVAAGTEESDED